MKILMLETMTYGDDISLEQFNRLGEVVTYSLSSYEEAVARMKEHNPDVVIINKTNMNAECMAAAPNLKMVAEAATGYNNIDTEYAKAHGIRVANVAGYSTQSVIQHTFALAFYLIEKMRYYDDFVKSGEYAEWPCFSHFANVFHELAGKTWGIVGLGNIGRGVAKIAADFGCNVIYYSASGHSYDVPYERYELDEFLKKSDIVSIHAPLNKYTENGGSTDNLKIMAATEESEKNLFLSLIKFADIIDGAYKDNAPHKICQFIYEVSNAFNGFYHNNKILSEPDEAKKASYIALISLTKSILEQCIDLLAIECPDRM